jgi:NAD(P)-dependent dehydrogenase (short-subunit alcohol dehydrogenase family)
MTPYHPQDDKDALAATKVQPHLGDIGLFFRGLHEMDMTLKDKRIVILGGTSGIGLATAQAAAQQGAAVIVASSRQRNVDNALAALPENTQGHALDLCNEDQIRSLFERIGPLDHLVFTAGETLELADLAEIALERARQAFNLRFWGAFTAVKYASRLIRKGGSIVLTTGVASLRPHKGWTVAASICGAMDALTRALAVELAPVRVNAVCPGVVRSPLWANMSEMDREAMYRDVGAALPVGRVGEASDIAETYLYLMRDGFSTGQVIVVDGGTVLV